MKQHIRYWKFWMWLTALLFGFGLFFLITAPFILRTTESGAVWLILAAYQLVSIPLYVLAYRLTVGVYTGAAEWTVRFFGSSLAWTLVAWLGFYFFGVTRFLLGYTCAIILMLGLLLWQQHMFYRLVSKVRAQLGETTQR